MGARAGDRIAAWALAVLYACAVPLFPAYNWDLVPYVACTVGSTDPAEAHRQTFAEVRRAVPEAHWRLLAGAGEPHGYRAAVHAEPESLAAQLAFYRSKALYVLALDLLTGAGLGAVRATHAIGAISLGAFAYLSYGWVRSFAAAPAALAGEALLAAVAFGTARQSTPDMMAGALMIAAYRGAAANRAGAALVLGTLAVATRPNAIAWMVMLLLAQAAAGHLSRRRVFAAVTVPAAVFLAVLASTRPYGWSVVFHHSFIEKLPDPSAVAIDVGWRTYLSVVGHNLVSLQWSFLLPSLFVGILGALERRRSRSSILPLLVAVAVGAAAVQYLAHPELADRLYLAHEATLLIAGVALLRGEGSGEPTRRRPAAPSAAAPGTESRE